MLIRHERIETVREATKVATTAINDLDKSGSGEGVGLGVSLQLEILAVARVLQRSVYIVICKLLNLYLDFFNYPSTYGCMSEDLTLVGIFALLFEVKDLFWLHSQRRISRLHLNLKLVVQTFLLRAVS